MKRIALCLALFLAPVMVFGTVIVDDSWADGNRSKTGALDADWWSSNSDNANSIEVSVGSLGLITGPSGRGIHATFAPQALAVGETITATYTFATPATVGSDRGSGFKVGMMDLNNDGLKADLKTSSTSPNALWMGLPGYMSGFDVNNEINDIFFREHDVLSTSGRFLQTIFEWTSLKDGDPIDYLFASYMEYTGVFSVTRTGADSVDLFSSMSQGGVLMASDSTSDTSSIANRFGLFGIWNNSNTFGSNNSSGFPDNGITLTHFQVEVIPEPATIGLMGVLMSGIYFTRRFFVA